METENKLNELADRDREWGPFLFLRPKRHARIGFFRALALSCLIGIFFGMGANVIVAVLARAMEKPFPPVYAIPGALTLLYFIVFRFTVGAAWNRRAKRLGHLKAFVEDSEQARSEQARRSAR